MAAFLSFLMMKTDFFLDGIERHLPFGFMKTIKCFYLATSSIGKVLDAKIYHNTFIFKVEWDLYSYKHEQHEFKIVEKFLQLC